MNDAEFEAQKTRVLTMYERWRTRLSLERQFMDHEWQRELAEPIGSAKHIAASTEVEWQYQQAKFTWCLPRIIEMKDSTLELLVVHEMVHVMLAPFNALRDAENQLQNDLVEHTTETVARAFIWMVDELKPRPVEGEY